MAELEVVHRPSDSLHIERVWCAEGQVSESSHMLSVTNSNWEMVIGRAGRDVVVAIRGPETQTSLVELPAFEQTVGIVFSHGSLMPRLPVTSLVDTALALPAHIAGGGAARFLLEGDSWELPSYENAEDFVGRLVRSGLLRRDAVVADIAAGADDHGLTQRSVQRRVAHATGLTLGAIRQIERARTAALMLQAGTPALEVVHSLGYYDQPHMARSLTRFIGRSATELQQREHSSAPLSLLYKTRGWDHT